MLGRARFSGTPANADVGTVAITVRATDSGGAFVEDSFNITVANSNDAPTVANPIPNQNATEDSAFSFAFAANTFNDVDAGATLSYTAQLNGGGVLPGWLTFDAATRTFSGTPANADVGTVSIDVIADDGNGGTVTDTFTITVANSNDARCDPTGRANHSGGVRRGQFSYPAPQQDRRPFQYAFRSSTEILPSLCSSRHYSPILYRRTFTYSELPPAAWLLSCGTRTFSVHRPSNAARWRITVRATDSAGVRRQVSLTVANT